MTYWFGAPPEVHSALLSAGPGSGPLREAATMWTSLSIESSWAAEELTGELDEVSAEAWQGPSAEGYVGAHAPYLVFLDDVSADCAERAAGHEAMAAAYDGALAEMPTLAELAVNRAAHAVLVATNFFGVNTIPIAANEAEYAEMWVRAASTMTVYEATSNSVLVLASRLRATAAPVLLKTGSGVGGGMAAVPAAPAAIIDVIIEILILLGELLIQLPVILLELLFGVVAWAIVLAILLPLVILAETIVFGFFAIVLTLPFLAVAAPVVLAGSAIALPTSLPIGISGYLADEASVGAEVVEVDVVTANVASGGARAGVAPQGRLVSVVASDRGAGALGFAGTAGKESVTGPAGLVMLDGGLGGGPRVPMLPATWESDVVGVQG
ncbi:ppe family protein [Mycobacterium haemophilum DSM 44634]|uniref:PPE family protein n=1 Tax=Mycobacterium haemophilum TaxID=29311 RepID=UPI00065576CC|nr:PPE family protein [Mycobacterium haemophilum]MCV7341892.1 PPE family protein [Mycobacterium haemophilum DSM 44634]